MKNRLVFLSKKPLLSFFVLAYLISWILWIPLIYGHYKYGWTEWELGNFHPRTLLAMLGALGPAISAIIMTWLIDGKTGLIILWKRLIRWKVKLKWWLIALYSWWLIASLITVLLNLKPLQNVSVNFGYALINIILAVIVYFPFVIGTFGEELGWRGFALPRLLDKYNPIVASLILSLPWVFWHAPFALFEGWRGDLPIAEFTLKYCLLIIPLTLIFTWFFKKTKGSILLMIVFHRAFNLTFGGIFSALKLNEIESELVMEKLVITLWIIATGIVIYYLFKMKNSYKTRVM